MTFLQRVEAMLQTAKKLSADSSNFHHNRNPVSARTVRASCKQLSEHITKLLDTVDLEMREQPIQKKLGEK